MSRKINSEKRLISEFHHFGYEEGYAGAVWGEVSADSSDNVFQVKNRRTRDTRAVTRSAARICTGFRFVSRHPLYSARVRRRGWTNFCSHSGLLRSFREYSLFILLFDKAVSVTDVM
jgi:hypothetical protein